MTGQCEFCRNTAETGEAPASAVLFYALTGPVFSVKCPFLKKLHLCVQLFYFPGLWVKGDDDRVVKIPKRNINSRIRDGEVGRRDVVRRLAELAFGKANDCIQLALGEGEIGKLDLSLLSEVRRSDKGAVEIRLVDRLKALEQLAELTEENDGSFSDFLRSLAREEDQ